MIRKLLDTIAAKNHQQRLDDLYQAFIRREAKVGGEIFGPVQKGARREFFCLDRHTWIWHEEWLDQAGQRQSQTTRYDLRPGAILKAQGNEAYQPVSPEEVHRLYQAVEIYRQRIRDEVYSFA